jgi:hypothetical protein
LTAISRRAHRIHPDATTDPGRFRVGFVVDQGVDAAALHEHLQRVRGLLLLLLREVAQAIHRRKVPELDFDVRCREAPPDSATGDSTG